jgi:hypothetical protein
MKKLPIGLQDFGGLRSGGYLYVDKTELLYQLVTEGKYYFLSRPRRFGKSLLVSTLSALLRGQQELFEELWIYDRWDWTKSHPVIHLSLSSLGYKELGLEKALALRLNEIAAHYDLTLQSEANSLRLRELIIALHQSFGQVVVLIDEYDKPILDYLDKIGQAEAHREQLKSFFSVLKDADPHLRLVLLTGVSKFSRVSIFSELNNLKDLTMHARYATLLGYTQTELEHYFADRLDQLAPDFGGREALLAQIKQWYNGYTWDAEHYVYNPFSILSFFDQGRFRNFWFETGTPTFLVKLLERKRQYNLEHVRVDEAVFSSFELERIDPNALLFQTGYITIASADDFPTYTLSYPNQEVRDSLLRYLLAEYTQSYASSVPIRAQQMKRALEEGDLADFVQALNSLFASIPYQIFIADKEAFYHAVTFLALSLMDTFVQAEVSQAQGRPDAVVHTTDTIYVLEFKLDERAEVALAQIKEKGYAQPYLAQGKAVKAVGLNFSSELKALDEWQEATLTTID